MSELQAPSIAFFDVDGTLVNGVVGLYASLRLVKHGVLKKRRIFQALYFSLADLVVRQDVEAIYHIATADMAGEPLSRMYAIGRESLEKDTKPRLYAEGPAGIRAHQARGDHVYLLSSGPYLVLDHLRDDLGLTGSYGVGPVTENSILTSRLITPLCYGAGKVHYATLAAESHAIPLSKCHFYTNDAIDLPLLKRVGFPNPVNPDRPLRQTAREQQWPILYFKETQGREVA